MNGGDELQTTLGGLEAGLHVRHIATWDLTYCRPDDDARATAEKMAELDFDHMPVKQNDRVVAVLAHPTSNITGAVRDHMDLIDESMLVSADAPLAEFVRLSAASPYRLVVDGSRIGGIVTRSDLQRLPVRVLAFTLVAHLEAVMARVIRRERPKDEDWLKELSSVQRKGILNHVEAARAANLDLDPLEFTFFSHKTRVVSHVLQLQPTEEDELRRVEHLRNDVAHGNQYAGTTQQLMDFVSTLDLVNEWIHRLEFANGA